MAKNQTTKEENRKVYWKKMKRVRMSGNFQAITKKLNENKNIVIEKRYTLLPFTWMEKDKKVFMHIMKANLELLTNYSNNECSSIKTQYETRRISIQFW